jgi:hypothetical protein
MTDDTLFSRAAAKRLALPEAATDAIFAGKLRRALRIAVKTLPSEMSNGNAFICGTVLTMRLGLGPDCLEQPLDEVRSLIPNRTQDKRYRGHPVTRERIRDIEASAIRHLRRIILTNLKDET